MLRSRLNLAVHHSPPMLHVRLLFTYAFHCAAEDCALPTVAGGDTSKCVRFPALRLHSGHFLTSLLCLWCAAAARGTRGPSARRFATSTSNLLSCSALPWLSRSLLLVCASAPNSGKVKSPGSFYCEDGAVSGGHACSGARSFLHAFSVCWPALIRTLLPLPPDRSRLHVHHHHQQRQPQVRSFCSIIHLFHCKLNGPLVASPACQGPAAQLRRSRVGD